MHPLCKGVSAFELKDLPFDDFKKDEVKWISCCHEFGLLKLYHKVQDQIIGWTHTDSSTNLTLTLF